MNKIFMYLLLIEMTFVSCNETITFEKFYGNICKSSNIDLLAKGIGKKIKEENLIFANYTELKDVKKEKIVINSVSTNKKAIQECSFIIDTRNDFKEIDVSNIRTFQDVLDTYNEIDLAEIEIVCLSNLILDSFDGIEKLENLTSLSISSCKINDFKGISFSLCNEYDILMINSPDIWISDSTVSSFNGLDKIENLNSLLITESPIYSGKTLTDINSIIFPQNLKLLSLTGNNQYNIYLSRLPMNIEVLSLSCTEVTEEELLYLKKYNNLKSIYLKDSKILKGLSEEEFDKLKENMYPIELKNMYIDLN